MKNKKGFTLIELLAVIVVLAIIALIATPIVMNTIKNTKKGAAERTADNYIKQVETAVAELRIDGTKISDGEYTIDKDGNLTGNGLTEPITIDISGTKPKGGRVEIKNGGVTTRTIALMDDYGVSYDTENNKYTAQEISKGTLCKAVTESTKTTGNVPQGNFAYGDEYTCELGDNDTKTFFVLENNGDYVSLIMNANVNSNGKAITQGNKLSDNGRVEWISVEDYLAVGGKDLSDEHNCKMGRECTTYEFGPITVENKLKENTKNWVKLNSSQVTLPTAYQIAIASGKIFDNSNDVSGLPTWLHDYADYGPVHTVTDLRGYWTSTTASNYYTEYFYAWCVDEDRYGLAPMNLIGSGIIGIRPVITVLKSNLN